MDKLLHSRFFRCLICFVLACAILINCSPLRAEATVIGATVVTGTAAAGILGLLFSMAMGVVFVDITAEMVSGIGQSVIDSVTNKYANDTETSNTVKEYFDNLSYTFGGSGDDGTGNGDDKIHVLEGFILGGFVAWVKSLIENDGFEVDEEVTADDGYAYYNGLLLPTYTLLDSTVLAFIYTDGTYIYFVEVPDSNYSLPMYVYHEEDGYSWKVYPICTNRKFENGILINTFKVGYDAKKYSARGYNILWSNSDIYYYDGDKELFFAGSEPTSTSTTTVPVTPDIYIGDIPSQVKDGSFDEEKYTLPYIDYSKILPGLNDYVTELNNLAQQLADNTKTYEEYMKDIQPEQTSDPDPSPDPSDPSDPEETKPEEDEGDEEEEKDLDMFSLDLSDYFPFCIPFDLYDFFTCLNAEPVAPVIEWFVPLPGGGKYPLRIDLSAYDDVAQLLRRLQLLLFCVGLAFKTRDLIKG